jgi:hypothetical protein
MVHVSCELLPLQVRLTCRDHELTFIEPWQFKLASNKFTVEEVIRFTVGVEPIPPADLKPVTFLESLKGNRAAAPKCEVLAGGQVRMKMPSTKAAIHGRLHVEIGRDASRSTLRAKFPGSNSQPRATTRSKRPEKLGDRRTRPCGRPARSMIDRSCARG